MDTFKYESRPIIIWGIKTAGKICYRLLQKLNVDIVAVGDNNPQYIGKTLFGRPVLALQEIAIKYPRAVIVIGSFNHNVTDSIIAQLKLSSIGFTFCRFEEIEYLYETVYLERAILDKQKLFRIINNVEYDRNNIWERKINEGVILEYRYVVNDSTDDLKETLLKIYGIRNLILIVGLGKIKETLKLIEDLQGYDNIGHIIVVIDYKNTKIECNLKYLSEKVFYIICDESAPEKWIDQMEEMGFIIDKKTIPDELFAVKKEETRNIVTERYIVESVSVYTGKIKENIINYENLGSKPVFIVQLFNGLANQVLMYLFGRFLEEKSGKSVIFDDTILSLDIVDEEENIDRICKWNKVMTRNEVKEGVLITREKNSFYKFNRAEVAEVFDIPIHLLSDYFDEETWSSYLNKVKKEHTYKYSQSCPLCQILSESGVNMAIIRDTMMPNEYLAVGSSYCVDTYVWGSPYTEKSVTDFMLGQNNVYFVGIWATGKVDDWLFHNRQWVNKILNYKQELDERNKKYAKDIGETDGIMLHIRRGDFAYFKMTPDITYYQKAIELIETVTSYKSKKYYIFSDDIEWCLEQKKELGIDKVEDRVVFVQGNNSIHSSIDLYLMSLGKVIIPTPGSSFSYVAILISKTVEKCICIPKYCYEVMNGIDPEPELIAIEYN